MKTRVGAFLVVALVVRSWLACKQPSYTRVDTSQQAFQKLSPGMSEAEIAAVLGGPPGDYTGGRLLVWVQDGYGTDDDPQVVQYFFGPDDLCSRAPGPIPSSRALGEPQYDRQWINPEFAIVVTFGADGKAKKIERAIVVLKERWYDQVRHGLEMAKEAIVGP